MWAMKKKKKHKMATFDAGGERGDTTKWMISKFPDWSCSLRFYLVGDTGMGWNSGGVGAESGVLAVCWRSAKMRRNDERGKQE